MNFNMPHTPFSTALSGSAKETEIRLKNIFSGSKKRPPILFLALMFSVCLLCGNLVSCNVAQAEMPDASTAEPAASSEPGIPVLPQEADRAVLDNIDLDGDSLPDQLTVVTRHFERQEGKYTMHTAPVILQVVLGSGQVLECRWDDPNILTVYSITAGHLTSEDHEDVLLEFEVGHSNYAASNVRVVRVTDGELAAEAFGADHATLLGACLAPREDSPLDTVRIPVSVDKWEPPAWYTLRWNGTDFDLSPEPEVESCSAKISDVLTVTLVPQGKVIKYDYLECFEQIQVWSDSVLIQTITETDIPQDDNYLFEGILSILPSQDGAHLDVRDVNFDGAEDFGIYCGASYNGPMYWFLWNEETWSYEPGFFSSIDLVVDSENRQLKDYWRDGLIAFYCDIYRFNEAGERELTESLREDQPFIQ